MAKWLSVFPSIFKGISEYFSRKHELRMKKLDLKARVQEAKALAEINYQQRKLEGEINWELESIKNSGWKDEFNTIMIWVIVVSCFIPELQNYTREGFIMLGTLPLWFQVIVTIAVSSAFGVRYFGKYTQLVQAKKQAEAKL